MNERILKVYETKTKALEVYNQGLTALAIAKKAGRLDSIKTIEEFLDDIKEKIVTLDRLIEIEKTTMQIEELLDKIDNL